MVMTRRKKRLEYQQVLERVRALPPADQSRLRADLAKLTGVYVLDPDESAAAIRRGRRQAAKIRRQLSAAMTGTLEETMTRLRGPSWS
jgi:hypothetical protein